MIPNREEVEIKQILLDSFGISVNRIIPTEGGWSASAFKIESNEGEYFLKVYDKHRSSINPILEKLDFTMSVCSWLEENTDLKGSINAPIKTITGEIKAETGDFTYLLFPFINGVTIRTTPLTVQQQSGIAEIVGKIHNHGPDMPFDFSSVTENFEIPCGELLKIQHNPNDPLCVHQQYDTLMRAIENAHVLAKFIKACNLEFALCHTDIHGWNLMQSDKLILIDWESIKFAPVESDLYTFWGDWYWGNSKWGSYWETFLPIYQKIHPQYKENNDYLKFYQVRRHIEDIEEFYKQYLYDKMTDEETNEVISGMERECKFLSTLI